MSDPHPAAPPLLTAPPEDVEADRLTDQTPALSESLRRRYDELAPLHRAAIAVLTWGFRIGAALLTLGLIFSLIRREALNTVSEPFVDVLPGVVRGDPAGVVDLAILWFMITPVITVIVVGLGFLRLKDYRYAALSLLVLAVLGASIWLALD